MADPDDALLWTAQPPAPRQPKPGELLFEFVRPRDRAVIRCELRFHGESYGWEVQFIEPGGHEFYARGGFHDARVGGSVARARARREPN